MSATLLSVRLNVEDRWRLRELTEMLGTNPSDAVRKLLRAAIPTPTTCHLLTRDERQLSLQGVDDDPAERDTLPPSAPYDDPAERDTLPPADPEGDES